MAAERPTLIIPTAINLMTAVNEVMVNRQKAGLPREIDLPSLRRRALLVVNEVGVLPIQMDFPVETTDFTR